MTTNLKKHRTQFYARTWVCWAGVLLLGPLVVGWFVVGLLVLLEPPDDVDAHKMGIFTFALSLFLVPMVLSSIFQVFVRQSPTLKMYREGIKIRHVWEPIQFHGCTTALLTLVYPIAMIIYGFFFLCRFLTLRLFKIQTFHLQWENITEIQMEKNKFTIFGWVETDSNDFEQDTPPDLWFFSYEENSFGTSIKKVIAAVQFFWDNPDARKKLPSWDKENSFENEIFDFDEYET